MKKKRTIYITVESVKRELNSKILLALRSLKKKNYRVIIGQKGNVWSIFNKVNPGIAFIKSFGSKNTKIINLLKNKNFKIVSNDEEVILAWDMKERLKYRMDNENLNKIDLLLAVGNEDSNEIKEIFPHKFNDTEIVGNLRLEILKKKYRSLLKEQTDKLKNKYGEFILFTTQFGRINHYLREDHVIDFVYSRIVDDNIDPESHHIKIVNEQIIMQREILFQTIKFLNNFEKKFPDKKILISPHPVESKMFWRNFIQKRKFKNILLNDDIYTTTHAYINASSLVISSNSTSLLEAYFLEKHTINFLAKYKSSAEIKLLKDICKVARSADEVNTLIENSKNHNLNIEPKNEKDVIKNLDYDFDAFDFLINLFDRMNSVKSYKSIFPNKKIEYYLFFLNKFRNFKRLIKKLIGYRSNSLLERLHIEKVGNNFNYKEFSKKVYDINRIEKIENLKIKQILPQVFLLDTTD